MVDRYGVIFCSIYIPENNTKINRATINGFCDHCFIAAYNVKMNKRIVLLDFLHGFYQKAVSICFAGTDQNISGKHSVGRSNFILCFLDQFYYFFGPSAEDHAFFGKGNSSISPDKKLLSEFFLQFFELTGQRRLGEVQELCCT